MTELHLACAVAADGTATKVGVFVRLSGGLAGPDGPRSTKRADDRARRIWRYGFAIAR